MRRVTLWFGKRFLSKASFMGLALLIAFLSVGPSFFVHYCSAANAKTIAVTGPIKKCCPDKDPAKGQLAQEGRGERNDHKLSDPVIKKDSTCCKGGQVQTHLRDGFTPSDTVKVHKPQSEQSFEPVRNNFEIDALQKLFDIIADFFEDFVPSSRTGRAIIRMAGMLRL
jgi:hypothetical protein